MSFKIFACGRPPHFGKGSARGAPPAPEWDGSEPSASPPQCFCRRQSSGLVIKDLRDRHQFRHVLGPAEEMEVECQPPRSNSIRWRRKRSWPATARPAWAHCNVQGWQPPGPAAPVPCHHPSPTPPAGVHPSPAPASIPSCQRAVRKRDQRGSHKAIPDSAGLPNQSIARALPRWPRSKHRSPAAPTEAPCENRFEPPESGR